jgi:transcriptional regulator with XRE-family HTH domain
MSSRTVDDTRRQRVQRARKRGMTVGAIAAREGVSTRTVERILSGRRFQHTLIQLRPQLAVRRLMHSNQLDRIIEKKLRVLEASHGVGLRIRDLIDLSHFAAVEYHRGLALLAAPRPAHER